MSSNPCSSPYCTKCLLSIIFSKRQKTHSSAEENLNFPHDARKSFFWGVEQNGRRTKTFLSPTLLGRISSTEVCIHDGFWSAMIGFFEGGQVDSSFSWKQIECTEFGDRLTWIFSGLIWSSSLDVLFSKQLPKQKLPQLTAFCDVNWNSL